MLKSDSEPIELPSVLSDIFDQKRILVCVGSGGVGKTTTAAALSLRAALVGHRALVLTIDPAKRLANSLGLGELGHDVQRVDDRHLDQAAASIGVERRPGGELHAMMLDQKRAFDEIVATHASDPEGIRRILENPVYAQISSSLSGAQEYAAIAKLHEFDSRGDFDIIVVDTPPTAHALDFLDAPEKLTNAIDSPAIEWFRKLRERENGGWSVVGRTGGYILKRLSKFVGSKFLDDLAIFFTEFNDILGGFHKRAEETFDILRQDKVGFILVASPERMAVREALFFHDRLLRSSMPFSAFVVNKVHDDLPLACSVNEIADKLAAVPSIAALGFQNTTLRIAAEAMVDGHEALQGLATADRAAIEKLRAANPAVTLVPFFHEDIHDLDNLASLGAHLFNGP